MCCIYLLQATLVDLIFISENTDVKMPFKYECASKALHDTWGCRNSNLIKRVNRVPKLVASKLLCLSGLDPTRHPRREPLFCEDCFSIVLDKFPHLQTEERQSTDHEYSVPLKKPKLSTRTPLAGLGPFALVP